MSSSGKTCPVLLVLTMAALAASPSPASDFLSDSELKTLALQRYWKTEVPLLPRTNVTRIALLNDNCYVLSSGNQVFTVHAPTGVLRWSRQVAEEGQTVRGPTHGRRFAFFTTPGTVRVMARDSGDPAGEPRKLRGVIVEVRSDTAAISIGEAHGVRAGDLLNVYRIQATGELEREPLAQLKITSLDERHAKGRLTRLGSARRAEGGDVVVADVVLPLPEVKLPFAASSAAVADDQRVYVGAANQRFYSIGIKEGFSRWQLLTPNTVSSTPVLVGEDLYMAGQDGRVISIKKDDRTKNWIYETEGPIFADIVAAGESIFVACGDRSLYCLDGRTGRRLWRERFDTPLLEAPVVAEGRVYQQVPQHGLFVMDAKTGKQLWKRGEGGRFLVQWEEDAYLLEEAGGLALVRVHPSTGKLKSSAAVSMAAYVSASQEDGSIVLAAASGEVVCLRSEKAPRLTPAKLAQALRDQGKIERMAQLDARADAEKAKARVGVEEKGPKPIDWLWEEDWLTSRSKAKPVGGHGLVKMDEKAGEPEKAKAVKKEKAETEEDEEEAAEEEGDEEPTADADDDESDEDEETTADEEDEEDEAEQEESDDQDEEEEEEESEEGESDE